MIRNRFVTISIVSLLLVLTCLTGSAYCQDDDNTRNVIKQGLLGAGTGAIAAGTSGGNAGTGALVGAGTGVIGSVLLDAMTAPPRRSAPPPQQVYYAPAAQQQQQQYYPAQPAQGDDYYVEEAPQPNTAGTIIKQGLLGAGTGAIAAGASGGNAGKGALIGAGTGVIGSALLDMATQPQQQPRRVYRRVPVQQTVPAQSVQPQNVQVQDESAGQGEGRKKVIKKYDANGKLVSEEETYY